MEPIKYGRTFHIPGSPGAMSDDKYLPGIPWNEGDMIVITEKRDGENTTFRKDRVHARSLDTGYHGSREWVRRVWGAIAHELPVGFRFCGENLYAKHSLGYNNLTSWFEIFGVFDDSRQMALSWDEVIMWHSIINSVLPEDLQIGIVPVLYRGSYSKKVLQDMISFATSHTHLIEGFVIRPEGEFATNDFSKVLGKWVRPGHVQLGSDHWTKGEISVNGRAK